MSAIVNLKKGEGRTVKSGGMWIYDNEIAVGFISLWNLSGFVFIEHIAIDPDKRSGGYGSKAIELVNKGAKLIGANPDITGPTEKGVMPATGSLIAPIEIATGKKAYFVGKPNPVMIRHGLNKLGCHSEEIAFIGDRMDTDIIAGIESNVDTVLVLSGVTSMETIDQFPYRPKYIFENVGEILTRE